MPRQYRCWLLIALFSAFAMTCWDFYSSTSKSDDKSSIEIGIARLLIGGDARATTILEQIRGSSLQDPVFYQFMIYVINYGKDFFWASAGILLCLFGGWTGRKTAAVMALSFFITALIVIPAKDLVGRERPEIVISNEAEKILNHRSEYSFPSGHASLVSAGTVVATLLFRGTRRKSAALILLTTEAVVVSFAQVYTGVHYFSDIMGGIIIGTSVALLSLILVRHLEFTWAGILVDKFLLHLKTRSISSSKTDFVKGGSFPHSEVCRDKA
jgi:membrane-associated phospholipid phosphatase